MHILMLGPDGPCFYIQEVIKNRRLKTCYYTVGESIHNILKKSFHFFMGWEDDLHTIQETEFVNFLLQNDKIHLFPC